MATVPAVPGVPAVIGAAVEQALTLLQFDTFEYFRVSTATAWGIYLNGAPVITADTITDFAWRKDWVISDYQVERGAFESYDKVERPHETHLRFAAGGSDANRAQLLAALATIAPNLALYDIVTPEITYTSCNIQNLSYQRQPRRGLGLLQVDVSFIEIRQTVSEAGGGLAASSTASPASASAINGGTVQPKEPTPAERLAAGEIPV